MVEIMQRFFFEIIFGFVPYFRTRSGQQKVFCKTSVVVVAVVDQESNVDEDPLCFWRQHICLNVLYRSRLYTTYG